MKWESLERREMTVAIVSALALCWRQNSSNGAGCAFVSVAASCCPIVEMVLTLALVQIRITDDCVSVRRCVCSSSLSPCSFFPVCAHTCMHTGAQLCTEKAGASGDRFPFLFCSVILNTLHRAYGGPGGHSVCQLLLPPVQGFAGAQTPVLQVSWLILLMDWVENWAKNSFLTSKWAVIGAWGLQ